VEIDIIYKIKDAEEPEQIDRAFKQMYREAWEKIKERPPAALPGIQPAPITISGTYPEPPKEKV
jgi:hypothetical protein